MNVPGFTAEQALPASESYRTRTWRNGSAAISSVTPEASSGSHGRVVPAMSFSCGDGMCCVYFSTRYCCSDGEGSFCERY
jgi:hypothetical protein